MANDVLKIGALGGRVNESVHRLVLLAMVVACGGGKGNHVDPPIVVAAPSPPTPLADVDKLPLTGTWTVIVRTVERGDPDGARQYTHRIRIADTGEIHEIERHEYDGGKTVRWEEAADAVGFIHQVDRDSVRMKWKPEDEYVFSITSRDASTFVLVRREIIRGPSDAEYRRMPYPRSPRGDRSFSITMTFKSGSDL